MMGMKGRKRKRKLWIKRENRRKKERKGKKERG